MSGGHKDRNHPTHAGQVLHPPAWLSTDDLEDLLLAAIEANPGEEAALTIIDEYFVGGDAFEPEPQHRKILLWLLSLLWPRLADLLGCPPAE
jgi:hypothetical protein